MAGAQLGPYGVRPKTMWIGKSVARGYFKADFQEIFHRYTPKAQARALLDELKVLNQPPKAEEDSVSNQGQNQMSLAHRRLTFHFGTSNDTLSNPPP